MKESLKVFINKQEKLDGKKPTFFSQLFSSSLWAPKISNVSLSHTEESIHRTEVEALAEADFIDIEANAEPKESAPELPEKEIKIENKIEVEKIILPTEKEIQKSLVLDGDFTKNLSNLNSEWKIEDIAGIEFFNGKVDILFYGLDEIEQDLMPDLVPFSLIESEQDLLGKMITAMNMKQGNFVRFPRFKVSNPLEVLALGVSYFKPKIIVTLGAAATNEVLEKKVKLTSVHGNFYKKQFVVNDEKLTIDVCPLFHPQLLEINQSMKRTAWLDMKKMIEKLG